MRQHIIARRVHVVMRIVELLRERGFSNYSATVTDLLTELVRLHMRALAQQENLVQLDPKRLLEMAIKQAEHEVQHQGNFPLGKHDLQRYWGDIRKHLFPASQEITQLTESLRKSKGSARIGNRYPSAPGEPIRYEIVELGLAGAIEGLLVQPSVDDFVLSLEHAQRAGYFVDGHWFPYEVRRRDNEDLLFVLDDDGTIYVSIENLPMRLQDMAKEELARLAHTLYIPHAN